MSSIVRLYWSPLVVPTESVVTVHTKLSPISTPNVVSSIVVAPLALDIKGNRNNVVLNNRIISISLYI